MLLKPKNAKAFGDKLLYDNLNFTLPQAGIVGIIGQTVLVNQLFSNGRAKADSGEFSIGDTVKSLMLIKHSILIQINRFGKTLQTVRN
jgi:ABC-type transporter Mla maintaining outer membrane lipid asymmetry ATPase subunit MlaF